ncbi:MAG: DUF1080 domain-containing protein [Bacteroidales bacterium]|nr:DUF1080 domain-containing protein [Bacteroidales bacterium]
MRNCFVFCIVAFLVLVSSCNRFGERVLFNGLDVANWKTAGDVRVKDSALCLNGVAATAIQREEFKDFELCMKVRTTPGGKGFLGFHTDSLNGKGYRVAINNDRTDSVWWRMTGSLMSVRNLTKSFVKENEWFAMRVRVEGKAISVFINDETVVEYIEPSSPFRNVEHDAALLSEGCFSLTSTGTGAIECKDIVVKELDTDNLDSVGQSLAAINEQTDEIIRLHQEDFPVLDYHVHLKGRLTKEKAAVQSRKSGVNYAIAPNCGIGFKITNDSEIYAFLDAMRTQPFILAMQGEGREWVTTFSQAARDEFDYVFTDALTFTDTKGNRTRLWIKDEVFIDDEQQYMDLILDKICGVLQEPADIYVNPCFLPEQMNDRYDFFWTEARMNKFVDVLAKSGKVLEINELYKIPSKAIILKAKAAGVKFSFGSNNVDEIPSATLLSYSIRMKKECGITARDMYRPRVK